MSTDGKNVDAGIVELVYKPILLAVVESIGKPLRRTELPYMLGEQRKQCHTHSRSNSVPAERANDAATSEDDLMREMTDLLDLMARLRDPEHGCPWDREQTYATIVSHTIEEAYEVADAIARADWAEPQDEWGDLLFQVA